MANDLYHGWMVLVERGGFTEALAKPVENATTWDEAFAKIVLPTEIEADAVASSCRKKAHVVPVTVRDNGKIVFRGNSDMIFTPEEIYRDAKMDLPEFSGSKPAGLRI